MSYEMIFLDIDGTLTNSNKEITPRTKEVLIAAQERGCKVAIASGRPDCGVNKLAKEIKLDVFGGYVLPFNGCHIRNFKTNELIFNRELDLDSFQKAYAFAKLNGIDIITYENDCIIAENPDNKQLEIEQRINDMPVKIVDSLLEYVNFGIPKCLLLGEPEWLAKLEPLLRHLLIDTAEVFRSEPFFLEVMPKDVNKATSIARLIEMLGIKREDTIACGDGYNDVSMIQYAGLGVAMENACDAVKSVADFVTLSNENDGIAYVVERFLITA